MCWIMVLGCNHELHGTSGDCASLAGTKAIAGELCGRQIAHLCTLAHPTTTRSHTLAQPHLLRLCARFDAQDAVEHCR